jgi:hypothetical protein
MFEALTWSAVALFPILFGAIFTRALWRHFKPIACPECQHVFPVPTKRMPATQASQFIGKYGYRCPKCQCESDYRGIPLPARAGPANKHA